MNDEESGDTQVDAGAVCRYRGRCAGPCQRLATDVADPAELADLDCIRSFRLRDVIVYLALTAVVTVLCFVGAYRYFFTKGIGALDATAGRALSLYSQRLDREIDKFGMLPLAMSMNRDVIDYLGGEPGTFIGRDLSYRPYVQRAKAGHVEGYYAVGTTGNTAGYYLATAVENNGRRLGTVATKIGLDRLEHYWLGGIERRVVVLDENGVVVLSSRPEWKGRVTRALTDGQRQHLYDTQQYNRAPLATLVWQRVAPAFGEKRFVRVGLDNSTQDYLAVSTAAPGLAMQLVVLVDPTDARRLAFAEAGLVAILVALIALSMHIVYEKRLTAQEQRLSREALHVAYERLKGQFERRSEQLRIANEWLRREVAERVESEGKLRSYQDELIRTENLAVIGQMSAGLAHEINQPLAAMATLSENAVRFLQRGDHDTAAFNLGRIGELVTRMSTLTGRLRSFARRSDGEVAIVPLAASIDSALALLQHRLKKEAVALRVVAPPQPLRASCETVRLEQVLVNLLSNAIEAMETSEVREIEIRSRREGDSAVVEILDTGVGLSDTVQAKLFEPFFTTKKASGLGLGLAICADIAVGLGGSLTAQNRPEGGALFRLTLRAAPEERR
ncbi:sensor histidine kinase [Ralstonia syzygii subsp. celebesensis]|uniref:C4-dicarboxylate transport sensor protein DctB n=2 Tax=Ralstonia syzygii subsp. celebesensis TaxID=1310168 RepID=A0A1U9VNB5_9RALS|nr:two-component sensor histidine kinase [blood disease bacterium A2-HR MARDI]QQV57065.1 sensor histidine kinase [Ralstonia syzygii subsp. celebesensis]